MNDKMICDNHRCKWVGKESELLTAPDPFSPGDRLYACPKCKKQDRIFLGCDHKDCRLPATVGTPTPNGYRQTCYKHKP